MLLSDLAAMAFCLLFVFFGLLLRRHRGMEAHICIDT